MSRLTKGQLMIYDTKSYNWAAYTCTDSLEPSTYVMYRRFGLVLAKMELI